MMIKHNIKYLGCTIISLFSLQLFAQDTITIDVSTDEKTAVGIGYSVGGKDSGGEGKSYVGKGPKNKKYLFGYKKNSLKGANVSCGALTLTKNSTIILMTNGTKCHSVIKS